MGSIIKITIYNLSSQFPTVKPSSKFQLIKFSKSIIFQLIDWPRLGKYIGSNFILIQFTSQSLEKLFINQHETTHCCQKTKQQSNKKNIKSKINHFWVELLPSKREHHHTNHIYFAIATKFSPKKKTSKKLKFQNFPQIRKPKDEISNQKYNTKILKSSSNQSNTV